MNTVFLLVPADPELLDTLAAVGAEGEDREPVLEDEDGDEDNDRDNDMAVDLVHVSGRCMPYDDEEHERGPWAPTEPGTAEPVRGGRGVS